MLRWPKPRCVTIILFASSTTSDVPKCLSVWATGYSCDITTVVCLRSSMKVEMYFLLLVILTATVIKCGQGKRSKLTFIHAINIFHPLPVLWIKSCEMSRQWELNKQQFQFFYIHIGLVQILSLSGDRTVVFFSFSSLFSSPPLLVFHFFYLIPYPFLPLSAIFEVRNSELWKAGTYRR